jgi:copper chaperone NosL
MATTIEPGEWRIVHGEWRDEGAGLTIIATRPRARRHWRPDVTKLSRILATVAALLLLALYVVPLWTIQLFAPQYPEGLGMRIRLTTVVGARETDLQTINQLNHYIGMKPIEPGGIPELRYFPIIVGALVVVGLAAALFGKRRLLVAWLSGLAAFGAAGLVDFWRWSYDYGHNLDFEHAVIKVPGMTYQPPIIGTKQLLNFSASSWPAAGAWIALAAFIAGCIALWIEPSSHPEERSAGAATTDLLWRKVG